jgi:hypothetical protein
MQRTAACGALQGAAGRSLTAGLDRADRRPAAREFQWRDRRLPPTRRPRTGARWSHRRRSRLEESFAIELGDEIRTIRITTTHPLRHLKANRSRASVTASVAPACR